MMNKELMTAKILEAKVAKDMTWEAIAEAIGLSPVFTTSAVLGMNSLTEDKAFSLCETLGLDKQIAEALQVCPKKAWDGAIPQDPLIYRLYEVVGVYGDTMKALIHEKFGDGIMSAIDFSMDIEKEENPKGDRVVVTMNGKFLPYKAW
ncbi:MULTISPECIES: cyanase [unclassified Marinobacter]|uniref:cyanase n=1 Tax=unclassified Marinobacter TaxID=83889 RepID=UPI0026E3145B|nr:MULTISPECIES: cyanase [unclassified Marinobacter]MDO6440962.1 cyanase [Marinobacter sp. 2_MG-2023]MDO6823793.1 cyanase [Marinobacter sp. 1_MG-2023]